MNKLTTSREFRCRRCSDAVKLPAGLCTDGRPHEFSGADEIDPERFRKKRTDRQGRERKGDWMQTAFGEMFWPLDPRADEVHIEDIAHALSLVNRFGGHSKFAYSVGQHSILASEQIQGSYQWRLQALLHDASEAYIGDMIRPLKHSMPEFQRVEDLVLAAIGERFGVDLVNLPPEVKLIDECMLATEILYLRSKPPVPWELKAEPIHGLAIVPMQALDVELAFLRRFYFLGGK